MSARSAVRAAGAVGASLALRDYQEAGIAALAADWGAGRRRLAVVWPTGAGKTVAFARMAARVTEAQGRTLVLAHRDELISQACDKLRTVAPSMPVGVVKAERREWPRGSGVAVASVQSLRGRRLDEVAAWRPVMVIVDECHHAVADSYMGVLRAAGCFEPDPRPGEPMTGALAAGFTATLSRSDGIGLGEVWQKVSHQVGILELIRRRYLLNIRGRRVHVAGLDLRDVRRSRGDYQDGALGKAMMECLAPRAIARAYLEHAGDRQGIVFMPTVETAYAAADELNALGITARCVEGRMRLEDRRAALEGSRVGDVQVLTNCMVLTEGTDLPWIDVGVIGRPTLHPGLYVQMAGRILRPYPGQDEALLLDCVGVGARHRLMSIATLLGGERIEKIAEDLTDDELAALDLLGLGALDVDMAGAGSDGPPMVDGALGSYEFDLFDKSHRTWLQTRRGVWFIEAGTGAGATIVFLVPVGGGRYSVAAVPSTRAGGNWVIEDVAMDYAMGWGEQHAEGIGGYIERKASWRRGAPTEAQLSMLHALGSTVTAVNSRGQASDEISVIRASNRVDHLPMLASVTR